MCYPWPQGGNNKYKNIITILLSNSLSTLKQTQQLKRSETQQASSVTLAGQLRIDLQNARGMQIDPNGITLHGYLARALLYIVKAMLSRHFWPPDRVRMAWNGRVLPPRPKVARCERMRCSWLNDSSSGYLANAWDSRARQHQGIDDFEENQTLNQNDNQIFIKEIRCANDQK